MGLTPNTLKTMGMWLQSSSLLNLLQQLQVHSHVRLIQTMKFSTIISFATVQVTLQYGLTNGQIIIIDDCSSFCDLGMFCTNSLQECHGPPEEGACFNGTTSEYQMGCNDGYECADNMCVCFIDDMPYATTPPPTATLLPPYVTSTPTMTPAPMTPAPMTPAPMTSAPMTPSPIPPRTMAPTTPSTNENGIFTPCPSGMYWEIGSSACRGPRYTGECYNPATAMYQNGCAPGFSCINNKCSTTPPATFSPSVCYVKCEQSDEYCENGATTCRGPNYAGECFNVATGRFQRGCGAGYECANNLCVMS